MANLGFHHAHSHTHKSKDKKIKQGKNKTKIDTCWPSLKTCVKVATNVSHHQKRIPLQHPQWSYPNHRSHLLPIHSKLGARSPRIWPFKTSELAKSCQSPKGWESSINKNVYQNSVQKKNKPLFSFTFLFFLFSIVQSVGQKIKIKMVTFWNSAWVFLVDAFNRCLGVVPLPTNRKKIMP